MTDVRRPLTTPRLLPSWRLEQVDDTVRVTGGPDELHVLSELSAATFDAIGAWLDGDPINFATPELGEVSDFLTTIGALDVSHVATKPLQWRAVGAPSAAERVAEVFAALPVSPVPEMTVVVRTSGSLAQLVQEAATFTGRHLLVDLTGHHTVSLGPFVTPGLTSCVGCYGTRLGNRWGDGLGPDEPASQRWTAVAAELLAIQIERVAARTSPLVNATINWDLQAGVTTRDYLLRAPDCPVCAETR